MTQHALACRISPADMGHLPPSILHAHIRQHQSSAQPAVEISQPCPAGHHPGALPFYPGMTLWLQALPCMEAPHLQCRYTAQPPWQHRISIQADCIAVG